MSALAARVDDIFISLLASLGAAAALRGDGDAVAIDSQPPPEVNEGLSVVQQFAMRTLLALAGSDDTRRMIGVCVCACVRACVRASNACMLVCLTKLICRCGGG